MLDSNTNQSTAEEESSEASTSSGSDKDQENKSDFRKADHTIVLSDIHLCDAEPTRPKNPLWKRFKRRRYFVDRTFKNFLEAIEMDLDGTVELVLNGDIFDFDSVMSYPPKAPFRLSWLEKRRGMSAEEPKSRFKMRLILNDHYIFVEALREFVLKGHRLIFVVGNHDVELHWPTVQMDLMDALDLPDVLKDNVRVCEWFYISNEDTLIEHGNQYDAYCMCSNPIHPLIKKGFKVYVRVPFGNLAGRFLTNGMGLMNPHYEGSYIKSSLNEYLVFFWKYLVRVQPGILWTWFWGAFMTAIHSLAEGFLPPLKDPLMIETRVDGISNRANSSPRMVRALRELHVHPAIYNPLQIMKELWLDRALLLLAIIFVGFMVFSTANLFDDVSQWWFWIPVFVAFPFFFFYARSIESDVVKLQKTALNRIPLSAQISRVNRVIHGHTHREMHMDVSGVEHLNTGSWSNAYKDVECRIPVGRKCFAWIRPKKDGAGRESRLYEWQNPGWQVLEKSHPVRRR